jgi:hypothetical protein
VALIATGGFTAAAHAATAARLVVDDPPGVVELEVAARQQLLLELRARTLRTVESAWGARFEYERAVGDAL